MCALRLRSKGACAIELYGNKKEGYLSEAHSKAVLGIVPFYPGQYEEGSMI
jgi:hypothetical protein